LLFVMGAGRTAPSWSSPFRSFPPTNPRHIEWVYTTLLPPNAQFVEATGINNLGEVVGYFDETAITGPSGFQVTPILGFTYDDGVYREYSVPGEIETELFGISNAGEVVGYYSDEMGDANGFAATAEPTTWAMLLIGFADLGFAGYRASRPSEG
jgi:hypothetical protein